LQQEADALRAVAETLSLADHRHLFLRHATALEDEAARLDLEADETPSAMLDDLSP